jgi:DNA-binding LacI/PurR family transcriptional regulator
MTRPEPVASAPQRKVTINDVARAAGVGRQTVSNVLNGSGRVGTATRARVLEVVATLGYQPHQGARSLRLRRTMQLGYLMPQVQLHPSNLIMMQFLQSLVAVAAQHHYRVVVVAHQENPRDEIRRMVASRTVDGFVLSDLQLNDPRVELLSERGIPFACFGRTRPELPQHWADIDNAAGEAAAVKHVLGQGFTRLGYVGYQPDNYWDVEREDGFRAGLASHGIPGDGAGLLRVDHGPSARDKIRSFLQAARPDAVLTGSDTIAAIVYSAAAELDLEVGPDLAVTGFDGSIGAGLLHPQLTTVVIPVADITRHIVARVLRQLDHEPDAEPGELVPAPLRPAGSTSPRPAGSISARSDPE